MKNDKTSIPFQIMALTVPAAEAAVGKNWLPSLVIALSAFLLCTWMSVQEQPDWKWLSTARVIACVFILAWLLNGTHSCWPGEMASFVVPGALLLLAMYAVWKKSAMRASTVLRYGMYLILLLMAVLGIKEIKPEDLKPTAQLPDMGLAAVLLLPLLAGKGEKWVYNPIGIAAVAASILAGGSTSLYEYSRGLSLGGISNHVESLAACAITVGNFSLLCFLLEAVKREGETTPQLLTAGILAYVLYVIGVEIRPEVYVLSLLVLWVICPTLGSLHKMARKREKVLDKKRSKW